MRDPYIETRGRDGEQGRRAIEDKRGELAKKDEELAEKIRELSENAVEIARYQEESIRNLDAIRSLRAELEKVAG